MSQLRPIVASIRAKSSGSASSGQWIGNSCCVTATVADWNDDLMAHIFRDQARLPEDIDFEELAQFVANALRSFINNLATLGTIEQMDYSSKNMDAPTPFLDHVAKISIESTCSRADLDAFERAVVSHVSEFFDGHADLVLETCYDGVFDSVQLSTGDMATEAPPLGDATSIPLEIRVEGHDHGSAIQLDSASPVLMEIMSAGPSVMRATPGGRKQLAFLFLENEIESALATLGASELAYVISDHTATTTKAIKITCDQPAGDGLAPDNVALILTARWPEIFAQRPSLSA